MMLISPSLEVAKPCGAKTASKCCQVANLAMQVRGGRRSGCEQAFQHPQLHAVIGDVVAAAQQLNCLRLWRHLLPLRMFPLISKVVLI